MKTIECVDVILDDIIGILEKCGGPGGTPGPCPLNKPTSSAKPTNSSSSKPKKPPEKPKPSPSQKPSQSSQPAAKPLDPTTGAGALAMFLQQHAKPASAAPSVPTKPISQSKPASKPTTPKEKPKPTQNTSEKPVAKPESKENSSTDRTKARTRTSDEITKEGQALLKGRKLSDEKAGITEAYGKDAVKAYTSDVYYATANKKLREGDDISKVPPSPEMSEMNTLAKQPLAQPTVTYRGISPELFDSQYSKLAVGSEITAKGFVSTSLKPDVATEFASSSGKKGVVLEIKAKTGLYVDDLSKFKGEHEIVQAHGTRYRFVGIEHDVQTGKEKSTVVRLEEI